MNVGVKGDAAIAARVTSGSDEGTGPRDAASSDGARAGAKRRFQLILIKPSHYDDDGYVIRWWRSAIPSNSLASLYGLALDCDRRQILGPDAAIDIDAIDETNTRVDIKKIIARIRSHDGFGMVGLVGVQSNQYPHALDLARPLREAGITVVMGGFHVSGCLAMLSENQVDLDAALDMGVSLFAGEAEDRLDQVLCDAAAGTLKPVYNYMNDLPGIEGTPTPFLPAGYVARTLGNNTSFDAGRGCPFQCSFCTIINVQGRKSRRRSPDDIERLIRDNLAQGIRRYFITDDNFARNRDWEELLDRIIAIREKEDLWLGLLIQVDTLCHKIPNFIEKCKKAGVSRVFIGLENINPDNLMAAKKRQNKITEYRKMLLAWKEHGIITYAGYILGFPNDTYESIKRDIAIIQKELPLDILEFFFLTPLPGSEDHQTLWKKGVAMDADLNKYDLEHAVTAHPRMSKEEWEKIYLDAWSLYYTPEHMETIYRRAAARGIRTFSILKLLLWFSLSPSVDKVHPLQGGLIRLKGRLDRRPGLPVEPVWKFYPKFWWETISRNARILKLGLRLEAMRRRIERDPDKLAYTDLALTPVQEDEEETLEMFTHSEAARDAVKHVHDVERLTHRVA